MSGILSGKHAGFLSEEIFTEDVNIEAVDGDLLAEELEKAQEDLFIEQEKFNTAIEAECETNETVDEIEAALESGSTDVVHAKLLVNKLIKNNSIFYGNSKPLVSALESDRGSDARSILQAGLEDGKGMVNAIKEFIAKVWQKIKDAFAWVWKKMKDFWAWLTGASKKVEEKKEETVVAASAVNAATKRANDIKDIIAISQTSSYIDPDYIRKSEEAVKRYRERKAKIKDLKENPRNYGDTVVTSGKFKGKKMSELSFKELQEIMEGKDEAIIEAVSDIMVEEIIVEEVAKETGLTEEKVTSYISPEMMKHMKVFAFDPSLAARISIIVKKNFDTDAEKITKDMTLPTVLSLGATDGFISGFEYSLANPFAAYKSYNSHGAKIETIKASISKRLSNTYKQNMNLTDNLFDFMSSNNMSDWVESISLSASNAIDLINNLANSLDANEFKTMLARGGVDSAKPIYVKTFAAVTPISVSGRAITYINAFEKGTIQLEDVALVSSSRLSEKFIKAIAATPIGKDMGRGSNKVPYGYRGGDITSVQDRLEHLVKFSEEALARVQKSSEAYLDEKGSGQLKNNADWKRMQLSFIKLVSNVSFYNPVAIINAGKSGITALESVVNTLDLKGAIAQATKEFDSSKFKFDKK